MADAPDAAGPVPDVLESGPSRFGGTGRWRRPWVLLLVLAAGAALIGLRASEAGGRGDSPPAASAAASEPDRSVVPPPAPPIEQPACTDNCRPGRFRLDARTGFGPPGLRLVTSGNQPVLLDVGTGRTTPVPGLPLVADQAASLFQVPGGLVATVSAAAPVDSYLVRGSAPAVRLGRFDGAIPSRDGGLLAYDMGWNPPTPGRLASFTAAGRLRWQRPFRQPTGVIRDTRYGLLIHDFADPDGGGGPVRLVDPRTGAVRREVAWTEQVLTSTERYVVWLSGPCQDDGGPCQLLITDLGNGHTSAYPVPLDRVPSTAALTPDGRLAVGVGGLPGFVPGRVRDGFVALLDRSRGTYTRLPGLSAQVKHVPTVAWSPDGRWLLMAVQPDDQHDRLVLWRPGHAGLTVLPTVLPAWSLSNGFGLLIQSGA
jgi:hypothetical protein